MNKDKINIELTKEQIGTIIRGLTMFHKVALEECENEYIADHSLIPRENNITEYTIYRWGKESYELLDLFIKLFKNSKGGN